MEAELGPFAILVFFPFGVMREGCVCKAFRTEAEFEPEEVTGRRMTELGPLLPLLLPVMCLEEIERFSLPAPAESDEAGFCFFFK